MQTGEDFYLGSVTLNCNQGNNFFATVRLGLNMSINKKLGLVLATFLILNLLLLGITLFSDQGNAGVQINLAGKQRMLSQKLTKAALSYANSGYSGLDQEEIKSAHDLFDKTLKGLHHGDRSLNLEGTLNESVIKQLEIVKGIWQPISENVNILLNSAKTSSQKDIALGVLKKDNLTLLAEMNIVVGLYEKAYIVTVLLFRIWPP